MSAHPADVLADELDLLWEQLDPMGGWRPTVDKSGDMLRTIPAMEAELAKLRADLEKARAEIAFLDGDLLYWVGRAVSKGNANSDTEEAWERYEQWLRDR